MDYTSIEPINIGFTVYSKSGCINCTKLKKILDDNLSVYNIINCDEYLIEEKEIFLQFIKNNANTEYKTFPIVFFNGTFIGGLSETIEFIKQNTFNCI
jgi:glutaredoxin